MPRNSCTWKLAGTDTFRLSSVKILSRRGKTKSGFGTNMQNPSKDLCENYIPDDGKILCQVDQAGAEALIVAYLCKPGRYRELFLNGIKIHVYVAIRFFADVWKAEGITEINDYIEAPISQLKSLPRWKELDSLIKSTDKWETSKRYYYMAKRVCHSSNYGIQAPELAINILKDSEGQIKLSTNDVAKLLAIYHSTFPEIKQWNIAIQRQLELTRTLRNLQGYPRKFYGPVNTELLKAALAFIPQSTVGTITNIALTNLQYYIEDHGKEGWDILNNKHDSYLTQCLIGDKYECCRVMQDLMEQELKAPNGEIFRMKSEATSGFNWRDMK